MKCKICAGATRVWYKRLFDDRHGYPGYFDVYKCTQCGFGQTNPQISKRKIKSLYKNYYPRKNIDPDNIKLNNYKLPQRSVLWRKGLLNGCHFLVQPRSRVLDVGSGIGYSLLYLKNMGCEPYGIDPDENAKKVAKKFKLNFHHGFIDDKPFKSKKFDFVIANQVIEHTNNPLEFLKLCKQRLNSRGKIILSFPNTSSLSRHIFKRSWLHWHIPYHLNHFNKSSVVIMAEKLNLKISKVSTVTPNMWTNIQFRKISTKSRMGTRDGFWDGKPADLSKSAAKEKYIKKGIMFLEEYNYLNRVIDSFGFGDSFVVTMK